jgi:hypothetical protein
MHCAYVSKCTLCGWATSCTRTGERGRQAGRQAWRVRVHVCVCLQTGGEAVEGLVQVAGGHLMQRNW